ncbi:AAA family ATPase [Pectobacterium carotovorum]|uniref:AAA family ATPase n=1 Tax=Pectobacterium TaxID=122277 RepID=UPI000CCFF983|nr:MULTISPECIES: ATP-binding protein [Pectobacterium]MBA0177505.1 AAA family ATPase [Pectobacterium carotovorum]MBA0189786.1 AAA family ATPase [Pectobacterium odoriferum]POD89870.1 hypothetical protein BV925_20330 [Pectobacterium odoriferum]
MILNEQLTLLINTGLKGDKLAFARQAAKLARAYEASGLTELAEKIRSQIQDKDAALHLQRASKPFTPSFEQVQSLPTDKETKFELGDITHPEKNSKKPKLREKTIKKIEEFITFVKRSQELKNAGIGITPSMLLFGPPGCGKTLAAHHIASELNLPLITARCDSLVSSYLGSTSKNIRQLFDYASQKPCVLFLDELDSLAKARDDQHELGELKRVVVSLLQNIDTLPEETVLISASNHESLLDSAIWRRFEYRIPVELPDMRVRKELFEAFPIISSYCENISTDLALISDGLSCAFIEQCCLRSIRHALIYNNNSLDICFLIVNILESKGHSCDSEDEWITFIVTSLRNCDSKAFTIRKIAKMLQLSAAKVSRLTK